LITLLKRDSAAAITRELRQDAQTQEQE